MACKIDITLHGSTKKMPALGFGTWQAPDDEVKRALQQALEAGYRHIDCAPVYLNEKAIGEVISAWIDKGNKREDLFIVTKLPPVGLRPESVDKFFRKSLTDLQLDYIDLYLLHTPFGLQDDGTFNPVSETGDILLDLNTDFIAVWKKLEELVDSGLAKSIGVSNFTEGQISRLLAAARIPPSNLQIENHIYLQQKDLVNFAKKNNISVTAYSPLGSRGLVEIFKNIGIPRDIPDLLVNPEVLEIAKKHNKTPAQIALRYALQRGICAIPKSTDPVRLKQNIELFDFQLDSKDVTQLENLNQDIRICNFSFFKGVTAHPEFPFK